jgi:hypothetical protein
MAAVLAASLGAVIPASAQTAAPSALPSPSPSATPSAAPSAYARAKEWLHRVQTGDLDRKQLTDKMNAAITPDSLKTVSAQMAAYGEPVSMVLQGVRTEGDTTFYDYLVTFKGAKLEYFFDVDKDGKISGLGFRPAT